MTTGGGTIGMVDGVGNDLGFHLHVEACFPASGSGGSNEIDLTNWKNGTEWVDLVFYGPVRLEGSMLHVNLQWYNTATETWVHMGGCTTIWEEFLVYELDSSSDDTSLNVLRLTGCPTCQCTMPLGEYRIIEMEDGLKSDLDLQNDPDVQPFEYRLTLVD